MGTRYSPKPITFLAPTRAAMLCGMGSAFPFLFFWLNDVQTPLSLDAFARRTFARHLCARRRLVCGELFLPHSARCFAGADGARKANAHVCVNSTVVGPPEKRRVMRRRRNNVSSGLEELGLLEFA